MSRRYGALIEDAKYILQNHPQWSTLSFVHREGNSVACALARYGLSLAQELVWIEDIQNVLIPIVILDLPH